MDGRPPAEVRGRSDFNRLGAIHPNEQLLLEFGLVRQGQPDYTNRVIDILTPFVRIVAATAAHDDPCD